MSAVPPQNLEAEQMVLGAMMLHPTAIETAAEYVRASDFYRGSHGVIFEAATRLHDRGEPVDAVTLAADLERRGVLGDAGGKSRLAELATAVSAVGNTGHYAKLIREAAARRDLIRAGQQIAQLGFDGKGEIDALLADAESALTAATTTPTGAEFSLLSDTLDELVSEIDRALAEGKQRFGLRTGFIDLDSNLTGLHRGQLVLCAARPAMGKSTLAQNIAENVADAGLNAALFTLEMSREEVQIKSLSRLARIDSKKLRTARLSEEEYAKFREAVPKIKARPLYVEDNPMVTPASLRAQVRRLHRKAPVSLLVVDYVQLMVAETSSDDNRQVQVAAISRSLKLLARELQIPVLALAQLNRNLETRSDKRPMLADLRDSGALEQDADAVLFIYRDEYYDPKSDAIGVAEVIIAKNRMGPTATTKLAFSPTFSRFQNLAQGAKE